MADELELAPDYGAAAREETGASQEAVGAPKVEDVEEALKDVIDPELGINVVDLGLVYGIALEGADVVIDMTLTSPACPLTDVIEEQTTRALEGMAGSTRCGCRRGGPNASPPTAGKCSRPSASTFSAASAAARRRASGSARSSIGRGGRLHQGAGADHVSQLSNFPPS